MRLFEINQDLSNLAQAVESWIALEHTSEDISTILNNPISQKFKSIASNKIYRVVFKPYKTFQAKGVVSIKPQKEGFVSYSYSDGWGGASSRSDFDYSGDMLRFVKKVHPGDILLDFSSLVKFLIKNNQQVTNIDESEVWVKATPYYINFDKEEFVDAELRNGKMIPSDPNALSNQVVNRFYKMVVRYKYDPYIVAKDLGIPKHLVQDLLAKKPNTI